MFVFFIKSVIFSRSLTSLVFCFDVAPLKNLLFLFRKPPEENHCDIDTTRQIFKPKKTGCFKIRISQNILLAGVLNYENIAPKIKALSLS